jgi:sec-independent protein translocase protein TatA
MPELGVPELLIIAFIVVLLFGSKKLPGAAKSIGQSLKIFKDETKSLRHEDKPADPAAPPAALPPGATATTPTTQAPTSPEAGYETPVSTPHV